MYWSMSTRLSVYVKRSAHHYPQSSYFLYRNMTHCTGHRLLLPSSTCADHLRAELIVIGANKDPLAYGIISPGDSASDVLSKEAEGAKHLRSRLYPHQRLANWFYQHPFQMISKCRDVQHISSSRVLDFSCSRLHARFHDLGDSVAGR